MRWESSVKCYPKETNSTAPRGKTIHGVDARIPSLVQSDPFGSTLGTSVRSQTAGSEVAAYRTPESPSETGSSASRTASTEDSSARRLISRRSTWKTSANLRSSASISSVSISLTWWA